MCGIAGICLTDGRPIDRAALRRMADAITHRGPDGDGFYVDEGHPSIGLASRRLAVIDVAGGAQPITVEDGRYTIVYNGELYNADDVRRDLLSRGHRLRTACDTELVIRGYATWGPEVVDRLDGMWAFAIWDRLDRRLFLARDRLGIKPLVYATVAGGLVFGSEIKALIASGLVGRRLDPSALPHYLSAFAVPEPYTLLRDVRRLRAAHAVIVDRLGPREYQYWDCAYEEEEDAGASVYRTDVEALLADSVRRQMVSDVPLGVLLSGGIDSGLVTSYAAEAANSQLQTFTLGFDESAADEREPARVTAQRLGTAHHEQVMSMSAASQALPALLDAYDEPGQSLVQNHFISWFASESVTVALSGLGGDELFSAYPTHVAVSLVARLDTAPWVAGGLLRAAAKVVPSRRLRSLASLSAMTPDERVTRRLMHQTDAGLRRDLLGPDVRHEVDLEGPARHLQEHFDRSRARHPLNRLLYVYLKTYLTDELLRACDAMSMLHSLEVRVPFLDHRLVERAMTIPARHKMHGQTGKIILRDLAARASGPQLDMAKHGFSPPLREWLNEALGEQVRDVLTPAAVRRRGIFDPPAVQRVVDRCLAGDSRLTPALMMLYSFEVWAHRWLDATAAPHAMAADRATIVSIAGAAGPEPNGGLGGPTPDLDESEAGDEMKCDLSVIIVNWNTRDLVRKCLSSLGGHLAAVDHEVIVVDNASTDGSAELIAREHPHVRLLANRENLGFGAASNQGMQVARGSWYLLLNSDTALTDGSVAELFETVCTETDIGVAHCLLRYPDGRLQHTTHRFPSLRLALLEDLGLYKLLGARAAEILLSGYWDQSRERDVDWVTGAFMLVPRDVYEQTGGFDERLFMYGEDMEWCDRIRERGWRVRYYPQASIVHEDHASAEKRWGQQRVSMCLKRQRDFHAQRSGRLGHGTFMTVRVVGAALRTGYYAVRARVGPKAAAYREMLPHLRFTLRALVSLALQRR